MRPKRDPGRSVVQLDPGTAWAAVLARDREFDGRLVYGVSSTGIFCRPTCPSRRPKREHVTFFTHASEAQAAGFRPCLRCKPESHSVGGAVERVRAFIDTHLDERLRLQDLAPIARLSPAHLQRTFKSELGVSPRDYVRARRAGRFKAELRRGRTVTDALYEAGYGSSSRLYEGSRQHLGMTPGAYRRGGEGQSIRYTTAATDLGSVLLAATERGVCAVRLAGSARVLEAELRTEFPNAEVRRDDAGLRRSVAALLAHLAGQTRRLNLPLDVAASAFQWRVWRALQEIPYGETRSYADVAASVGRRRAARAVARACASNPVALVIPCHRVVRGDGSTGGYRWGVRRKRLLLQREKSRPAADR